MHPRKKVHPIEKTQLHVRNKHRERYDFKQLTESCPALASYVKLNDYNDESIDFFDPNAVKMLNKALLKHFYGIDNWNIPPHYLCPPIPGRADYIHHMADVLSSSNGGKIPMGHRIKCLDIGVGANIVYPIIGHQEYGWSFIGADIDPIALASAHEIVASNSVLDGYIELRLQPNPKDIFKGILQKDERIDVSICNPPFHASWTEAQASTKRKLHNLKPHKKTIQPVLNFGGQNTELWCDGGEEKFINNMILQSQDFATHCFWFSTLVSKQTTLKSMYQALKNVKATAIKTIPMGQGNKVSRLVAWTFLTAEQQKTWRSERW